jgi:thiamine pyrophosphokinase
MAAVRGAAALHGESVFILGGFGGKRHRRDPFGHKMTQLACLKSS